MCLTWQIIAILLVKLNMKSGSATLDVLIATGRRLILAGALLWTPLHDSAQCDLSIIDVDLNTYEVTIVVGEGEGCTVSMIQIGFHIPGNEQPLSLGDCVMNPNNFHPGWWYSALAVAPSSWADLPIANGDTITIPLDNPFNADCSPGVTGNGSLGCCAAPFLDYYISEGLCIEFVLWQVNFGATWYTADGGWATGTNDGVSPYGPDSYPDQDCDNSWYTCRENNPGAPVGSSLCEDTLCTPQYITDTLYVSSVDTLYVNLIDTLLEYVYLEADTVFLTETDTLILIDSIPYSVYIHDTTYVTLTDTVYTTIIETDTAYSYEYDIIDIDCETGHMCSPLVLSCPIYIPNSFTPNNDGYNDVWGAETPGSCWESWSLKVYSRHGDMIWEGVDPDTFWMGGDEYYVPSGVYTYRLACTFSGDGYIINGHVSVVR